MKEVAANTPTKKTESRWRLFAALVTIYLVWGSTYFAIGEAVRTIPPFLMAASRFALAGALLYSLRRITGAPRPDARQWRSAAIIGGLLILGGNGLVSWAEQRVPSGLAALIVSITPVLMVAMEWARPQGTRPRPAVLAGLLLGFVGMSLLIGPARLETARDADGFSTFICVLAPCLWAAGSIYSRQAPQSPDVLLAAAMQMLTGSICLLVASALTGEFGRFALATIAARSAVSWLYLTFVGSLLGFTAYIYLLKHASPAVASTYAYVNPAVAVLLGWLLGGEIINGRIALAGGLLLGSVALITASRSRTRPKQPPATIPVIPAPSERI